MTPPITLAQCVGTDTSHLIECANGHRLMADVAEAFVAIGQAAKHQGIDLCIASSHRDFERQLLIWNEKWHGKRPLLDINSQPLDVNSLTDQQKLSAILTWSALPGSSRHHWGTDLDVYDATGLQASGQALQLVSAEYEGNGPCAALAEWLTLHAHEFGFYRPYLHYTGGVAAEPWHISFEAQARQIIQQFDLNALASILKTSNIAGKEIVLNSLDEIFQRYVLNNQTMNGETA